MQGGIHSKLYYNIICMALTYIVKSIKLGSAQSMKYFLLSVDTKHFP